MIKDFKLNESIQAFFLVKQVQFLKKKDNSDFISFKLADKTGEIEAKLWDTVAEIQPSLKDGVYIKVQGDVGEYQGKKQLTIKKIRLAETVEINPDDFFRVTKKNINEMFENLQGLISTIDDSDLKNLLLAFINDSDIAVALKKAPAAVNMHSACIGGLLEHIDALLDLGNFVCARYPQVNRNILITGIILHDIGKLKELDFAGSFKYTDYGLLVGHLTIGIKMLNEKINTLPDFPTEKRMLLEHMILSHHGQAEFGSPKTPQTLEAVVLHYLDNLEAKITGFTDFVELNQPDANGWTPRAFMFDNRQLYVGKEKE